MANWLNVLSPQVDNHQAGSKWSEYFLDHQHRWQSVLEHLNVGEFGDTSPVDMVMSTPNGVTLIEIKARKALLNAVGNRQRMIWLDQDDYEKYLDIQRRWSTKVVVIVSARDGAVIGDLLNSQPYYTNHNKKTGWERGWHFPDIPDDMWQRHFYDFPWDEWPLETDK